MATTNQNWEHALGSEMADAVVRLRRQGVYVQSRAYGFYVAVLTASGECITGECGIASCEDAVELSLRVPSRGVYWIRRARTDEIAAIVIHVFDQGKQGGLKPLIESLRAFEPDLLG